MMQILDFVKEIGKTKLQSAAVIVDATVGNGHDTLWLKEGAPTAKIYGFDIQEKALNNAEVRLKEAGFNRDEIIFIHDSHSNIDIHVKEKIDLVLFNFGYLPGSDKTITTTSDTSKQAIEKCLHQLTPRGIAILVTYPGHEEGRAEDVEIAKMLEQLPWGEYHVYHYCIMNNTKNPPRVYVVEKS